MPSKNLQVAMGLFISLLGLLIGSMCGKFFGKNDDLDKSFYLLIALVGIIYGAMPNRKKSDFLLGITTSLSMGPMIGFGAWMAKNTHAALMFVLTYYVFFFLVLGVRTRGTFFIKSDG